MFVMVYGTRPEWIKVEPLVKICQSYGKMIQLVRIMQHGEEILPFQKDYPEVVLQVDSHSNNRLLSLTTGVMRSFGDYCVRRGFGSNDHVLVQGDTTTAYAVALAASYAGLKVWHLEAGLRTNNLDSPSPEEFNRRSISMLADYHICTSQSGFDNLHKEYLKPKCTISEPLGNTTLDSLRDTPVSYEKFVLMTLHRAETQHLFPEAIHTMYHLASKNNFKVLLPLHPRHKYLLDTPLYQKLKECFIITEPLDRKSMCEILASCAFVVTDSGGIQEEITYYNKYALVFRSETERPEIIGSYGELCPDIETLRYRCDQLMQMDVSKWPYIMNFVSRNKPYGKGYASKLIYGFICENGGL